MGQPHSNQRKSMKRQTHLLCRNCYEVLQEYRQESCDRCLIRFDESRLSFHKYHPLPFWQKLSCVGESAFNHVKQCFQSWLK